MTMTNANLDFQEIATVYLRLFCATKKLRVKHYEIQDMKYFLVDCKISEICHNLETIDDIMKLHIHITYTTLHITTLHITYPTSFIKINQKKMLVYKATSVSY